MKNRPSNKELEQKIKLARSHFEQDRWLTVDETVFLSDCRQIGLFTYFDRIDVLNTVLNCVNYSHYVGKRPPQKSYIDTIKEMELFAFTTYIEQLNETVYLKFAVTGDHLYIVSFHRDRKRC
jgi:hypothetical protein